MGQVAAQATAQAAQGHPTQTAQGAPMQAAQAQALAQAQAAQAQALAAQAARLQAAQAQTVRSQPGQVAGGTNATEPGAQLQAAAQAAQAHAAQILAAQAQAQAARAQAQAATAAKASAAKVAGGGQLAAFDEGALEAPALELDLASVPSRGAKPSGTRPSGARPSGARPSGSQQATGAAQAAAQPKAAVQANTPIQARATASAAKAPATAAAKPAPQPDSSQMGFGDQASGEGGFGDEEGGPALELAEVGVRVDSVKGGSKDAKAATHKEHEIVAALAGYEPKPTSLTGCVKYAIHVARRLIVLRKEREKAEKDAAGLEADLNTAFVEVGQGLMALQTDPTLAPLRTRVAAVLDAQSKVSDADHTMTKTREQNQQAVAALDREAAEMRQNLQPFLAAEQAAVQAHKKAEDEVKRGLAMQRRIEIELRALTDATAVQDPARAEDLRSQLDERRGVVAGLTVEMERMASQLGQARRELGLKKGVLDSIEDRKKRLVDEFQKKESEVEQKAKAAEGGHAAALRSLAETAREQGIAQQIVPDKLAWVEEVEGVLADAHKVVFRYDKALTLYDRPSVVKGWATVGGLVFVLLLLGVIASMQ